ncbi:hypothetical protein Lal_00043462 [Lupinus albus]|nr:hypothetical protein Lal_00043462 [Lupinus albus]
MIRFSGLLTTSPAANRPRRRNPNTSPDHSIGRSDGRLRSRSLTELTRQIAPPTKNGHAPPPIESRKSSQSVNPYYVWTCGVLKATSADPWSASFMVETRTLFVFHKSKNFTSDYEIRMPPTVPVNQYSDPEGNPIGSPSRGDHNRHVPRVPSPLLLSANGRRGTRCSARPT